MVLVIGSCSLAICNSQRGHTHCLPFRSRFLILNQIWSEAMESEFVELTINEEEEEILQIQVEQSAEREIEVFHLVGCFLTTSIIHFPAMKSIMENLWHPVRSVQIRDLGEKRYLFQFFHVMDMERVLKGLHWTFNNHLLVLYKLQWGEDPLKVPLILTPFWVQTHNIPFRFFSEHLASQLGNFIRVFMDYDGFNLRKENRNYMRMRVQVDICHPLKRKKHLMFKGQCSYVHFKYERLSLFLFLLR